MSTKNDNSLTDFDSIDIVPILIKLLNSRKLIIKVVIISFIIGFIIAILSPIEYQSHTTFVPQTSDHNSSTNKGYAELASLAGINLNAEVGSSLDNYISPLLYSRIIESDEFSMNLIDESIVTSSGEKFTIKKYIQEKSFGSINFGVLKKYTIGLFLKPDKNKYEDNRFENEFVFFNDEDYNIIKAFRKKFSIQLNEKEGYIKVLANDKDPLISTQIVKLVTKNLQSRIISLRTNKVKEQLDYSLKQYEKKRKEFEELQAKLAEFKDSNKNISTAVFRSELQKLESEYSLQQNILISLASEYNNNKIKLNKDTPIFSVLDEVSLPNEKYKPKRTLIVLIYTFIGFIISTFYILTNEKIIKIIQIVKTN